MSEVKVVLEEIKAAKKLLVDSVKKQDEQLSAHGEVNAATAKSVKSAHETLGTLMAELKAIGERMDESEAAIARADLTGLLDGKSGGARMLTPGMQVIESKELADSIHEGGVRKDFVKMSVNVGSFFQNKSITGAVYDDGSEAGESGGAVTDYQRSPGIIDLPLENYRLRDLLNVRPTTASVIRYVREKGYYNLLTKSTSETASGQKVVEVESASAFFVGQKASINTDAGLEEFEVESIDMTANTLTATVNFVNTHSAGVVVFSNVFAGTKQTDLKPGAGIIYENKEASVITIAHGIPMAKQLLEDAPRLQAYIEDKMIMGLGTNEDFQILYGLKANEQLPGILNDPDINVVNQSGIAGATKVDAIRRAMTLTRLAQYNANGAVVHPLDWEDIETKKGSDDHYLYTVMATPRGPVVWGLRVVDTPAIQQGTSLVGAFGMGAQLWDRMKADFTIFDQHKDYAARNMVYGLAEERLALEISRPQAFSKVVFS